MENYFLFKEKKIKNKKTRNKVKVSSHASLKNVAPNKKYCWSAHYCKSKNCRNKKPCGMHWPAANRYNFVNDICCSALRPLEDMRTKYV